MIGCLMKLERGVFSSRGAWVTFAEPGGAVRIVPIGWLGIVCADPPRISFRLLGSSPGAAGLLSGSVFGVNLAPSSPEGNPGDLDLETLLSGEVAAVPLMAACPVHLECRGATFDGDGSLGMVSGEVLAVHMDGVRYGGASGGGLGSLRPFTRNWRRILHPSESSRREALDRGVFGCK